MFRPRIIPVLLLQNNGLVKTQRFKSPNYIGDPINAVRLFNEFKADELVFLDIQASKAGRCVSEELVQAISAETRMPFAVGGGISNCHQIRTLMNAGAEKIIIGNAAIDYPAFVAEATSQFGASSIAVCIDVVKTMFGKQVVYQHKKNKKTRLNPLEFAQLMEQNGVGELIIQSVDNDGMMTGYDAALIQLIATHVHIPIVALGGASSLENMKTVYQQSFPSGLAAGSLFVYHGQMKGVLINYPDTKSFFL
jgi:cyclase